mmetsp:Transcript_63889/g.76795  ORF Transcript_63889/g.76795 Transcript_63889/m.76795 type:complete len:221 (+) Transcript_63889:153-815(+)
MTIVYSLVSREKTVLAEYTSTSGNFPTVTRVLLAKIPSQDGRMSYVYDDHIFHYVVECGICFLCMSDEMNKHRVPFALLNDMKELFFSKYGRELPQRAIAFSLNDEFSRIIDERMEYYNGDNPNLDSISTVQNQINDVRDVMVQNIEKVLERGEKIELLVDKTDRLNQQAFKFESSSRTLRRAVWWKKARGMACMGLFLTLLIYFVSASICGVTFTKCRK